MMTIYAGLRQDNDKTQDNCTASCRHRLNTKMNVALLRHFIWITAGGACAWPCFVRVSSSGVLSAWNPRAWHCAILSGFWTSRLGLASCPILLHLRGTIAFCLTTWSIHKCGAAGQHLQNAAAVWSVAALSTFLAHERRGLGRTINVMSWGRTIQHCCCVKVPICKLDSADVAYANQTNTTRLSILLGAGLLSLT